MRTKWMLIGIALLTAVLAIGAIACGDDDDELEDLLDELQEELDDLGVLQLVAHLSEMDGSGASGEADISLNGDGIFVQLSMEGLTEGTHENHLHHGSCAELAEVHIALDNIVADENGDGSQVTSNDEFPIDHFETGHSLAVHAEDGTIVACGDVVAP